jgi:hypothetical protein
LKKRWNFKEIWDFKQSWGNQLIGVMVSVSIKDGELKQNHDFVVILGDNCIPKLYIYPEFPS